MALFQSPSRTTQTLAPGVSGPALQYSPLVYGSNITGTGAVNRPSGGNLRSLLGEIGPIGTPADLFGGLFSGNLNTTTVNPVNTPEGRQFLANIAGRDLISGDPVLSTFGTGVAGTRYAQVQDPFLNLTQRVFDPNSPEAQALLAALGDDPAAGALGNLQSIFQNLRTSVLEPTGDERNQSFVPDFFPEFRPGGEQDIQASLREFLRLLPEQSVLDDPLGDQAAFSADQFKGVIEARKDLASSLAGTDPTLSNEAFVDAETLGAIARGNERASQSALSTLQNALAQSQGTRQNISGGYKDQAYSNLDQFYQNLDAVDVDARNRMARIDQDYSALTDRFKDREVSAKQDYSALTDRFKDREVRAREDYSALTDQFRDREGRAEQLLERLGDREGRGIRRGAAQARAQQSARNLASGLANTTVAGAQDRRLREQETEQYGDLQQRLNEQRLGVLGQFTGDTLRAKQAELGILGQFTGDTLGAEQSALSILEQFTGDTLGAEQAGLQAREPLNQAALQAQISGLGRGADAADTITRTAAELDSRTADTSDAWTQALAQFQKDQTMTASELANTLLQIDANLRPGV